MDIDKIVNIVIEKIKAFPDETEFSISKLIPNDLKLTSKEDFVIYNEVMKKIKSENIILDSYKNKSKYVGLPFNMPFVKKSKINKD